MISFKGRHFEKTCIMTAVRWYLAYPLSYRDLEEIMKERGVDVDHSTINRWVVKYSPQFHQAFVPRKRPVGTSWRLDETYSNDPPAKPGAFVCEPLKAALRGR